MMFIKRALIANCSIGGIAFEGPKLLTKKSIIAAGIVLLSASASAIAQDCVVDETCPTGQSVAIDTGANTESNAIADVTLEDDGFAISIDGETTAKPAAVKAEASAAPAARQRVTDAQLEKADIQVKFDGLDVKPALNVLTADLRRSYKPGETVNFRASTNYASWIERAEIRIMSRDARRGDAPIAVLPAQLNAETSWTMPEPVAGTATGGNYDYVLRVYDNRGRFDETAPSSLASSEAVLPRLDEQAENDGPVIAAGEGEDRAAVRNIPVYGGAVTVYGRNVSDGYSVAVLGEDVKIDANDSFVIQRILPPGDHLVAVDVRAPNGEDMSFDRDINIPENDWFYVGVAEATIGKRFGNGAIVAADAREFDDVYAKGRLSFYLKGKIKGRYILTASADTEEENLSDIFRGLDKKNPRQILRRIDPDKYYPVYGDDSTIVEDAPTSGKFYIRLERGDSHVMWGNFKSAINGSQYLRSERALYGAHAQYKSEAVTSFGERVAEVSAYAAQPESLAQRDVLRGTGGSTYFLSRQDISIGSETLTIEVRDGTTGRVLSRKKLTYGEDYTIDYVQGVVILTQPLRSSGAGGSLVQDSVLGDNRVNLVAQYEYTPTAGDVDGYSFGGRGQVWLADRVRFGVTGMRESTGNGTIDADQDMLGVDVLVRHSENTYLEAEYAQTKGPGFGVTRSSDGGLTLDSDASAGSRSRTAAAWRVKGQIDLADISQDQIQGRIGAYYENKQDGFSTIDYNISVHQQIWGAYADIDVSDNVQLKALYDHYQDADGKREADASVDLAVTFDDYWKAEFGVKYSDVSLPASSTKRQGSRTDVAAKINYTTDQDHAYYVFGQATVQKSGSRRRNDRIGAGAAIALTDKIGAEAEVSYGTTGWGALAALTYDPNADEHYYVGYELDSGREIDGRTLSGTDLGGIVFGATRRYNDVLSAFTESNYDMFGQRRALTSTYGITYTPDTRFTVTGGLEIGRITDHKADDFDRKAVSLGFDYKDEAGFTAGLRGEARIEDSENNSRDRNTYLFSANAGYKVNPDWRVLAKIDGVISDNASDSFLDGDYVEGSIGFAYRPVNNDRFNALFKYTYLYDLPGNQQVTADNTTSSPRQQSHVLSADFIYDVNRYLSVGAKYGMRLGKVETVRGSGDYQRSDAHLGIIRADVHVIHNWDVLLEGRVLHSPTAKTTDYGALAAVYRHFGNNFKVGVGYNFGKFSDDLTDLTFDDRGVFVNAIAKF